MFINPPLVRKTNVYCGSPGGTVVKSPPASAGDARDVGSGPDRADPPEKGRQPTPVFSPGKSHRQRSPPGYSPWVTKESDTT